MLAERIRPPGDIRTGRGMLRPRFGRNWVMRWTGVSTNHRRPAFHYRAGFRGRLPYRRCGPLPTPPRAHECTTSSAGAPGRRRTLCPAFRYAPWGWRCPDSGSRLRAAFPQCWNVLPKILPIMAQARHECPSFSWTPDSEVVVPGPGRIGRLRGRHGVRGRAPRGGLLPGDTFAGLTFQQLVALGEGRHELDLDAPAGTGRAAV